VLDAVADHEAAKKSALGIEDGRVPIGTAVGVPTAACADEKQLSPEKRLKGVIVRGLLSKVDALHVLAATPKDDVVVSRSLDLGKARAARADLSIVGLALDGEGMGGTVGAYVDGDEGGVADGIGQIDDELRLDSLDAVRSRRPCHDRMLHGESGVRQLPPC
jgi:hypothetical protein